MKRALGTLLVHLNDVIALCFCHSEFRQVSLGTFLLITIYMWGSVCYCYSPKKCNLPRGISCNCVLVFIHVHLVFFLGLCQILTWWYRKRKRYIQTCSLYGYSKELILQCFVSSLWFLLKLHLASRVKSQEWISLEWKIEKEKSLLGLQNPSL